MSATDMKPLSFFVFLFFFQTQSFYNKVKVGSSPQTSVPHHFAEVWPPGLTHPGQGC